jgi:hypothetical protein
MGCQGGQQKVSFGGVRLFFRAWKARVRGVIRGGGRRVGCGDIGKVGQV